MSMLLSRYFQAVDLSVFIQYKNLASKKRRAIFENALKEIISFVCVHIKDNNNSPHGKFH